MSMCTLAPCAAAAPSGFGATTTAAFLDRRCGVVVLALPAPASCSEGKKKKTGEPTMRRAAEVSTAAAPARKKRDRHDDPDPASMSSSLSALHVRMDKEFVALQGLLKRAKLLPARCSGSAPPAEKKYAPPVVSSPSAAGKSKTASSPSKPAMEAMMYAPAKQQPRPVTAMQRAPAKTSPITPEVVPNNKHQQRPAEAPLAAKQQQQHQHPIQRAAAAKTKTTEVPKKRRPEEEKENEVARAAARAAFRQMQLEMEKSALPDETVYPEEMAALGIPFEFQVTRTWKQACRDHAAAKKALEFVGVV